jgi:hypothetical protein
MPDVALKAMPDVPNNLDRAMWNLLISIRHNIEVLSGTKGSASNKYVSFGDLSGSYGLTQYVSVTDVDDPAPELASRNSGTVGAFLVAYQDSEYTIYAWRAVTITADSPYVVTGDGGSWIAVGGKYSDLDKYLDSLTASRLVATDAGKKLVSILLSAWIAGTTDEVTVTADGSGGVALSLPGAIKLDSATASRLLATDGDKKTVSVASLSSWVAGIVNRITITDDGDGSITLNLPQDIHTGASPTFAGLDLTGITDAIIPYIAAAGFADSPLSVSGSDVIASGNLTWNTPIVSHSGDDTLVAADMWEFHIVDTSGGDVAITLDDGANLTLMDWLAIGKKGNNALRVYCDASDFMVRATGSRLVCSETEYMSIITLQLVEADFWIPAPTGGSFGIWTVY